MATVRLTEYIGLQRVYDFLKSNGLDMRHDAGYYGYGMMVGGPELTLENILYGYTHILPSVSHPDTSTYLLQYILSTPRYRARTFGENSILNTTVNWAVKTGTSTNWRDNWAI
jgi:penicillin-binding protein 1C